MEIQMGIVTQHALPNLKEKPYGGAWSIHNTEIKNFVIEVGKYSYASTNIQDFLHDYRDWAIREHQVLGIEQYPYLAFANGTTEVFTSFYHKYMNRRLRLFRGEYFYHMIMSRIMQDFAWIDQEPLEKNDVVVVSMPFSDTGCIPALYRSTMEQCEDLNVPVCIDMAYLNISKHTNFNIEYKCIETVATSLSKVFPVEHMRIGLRLNRYNTDDVINAYSNNDPPYVNTHSIYVGHKLINEYPNDWIYHNYKDKQAEICKRLNVTPSDCVIFGIDYLDQFNEYNRGSKSNRLCFSKQFDGRNIDACRLARARRSGRRRSY